MSGIRVELQLQDGSFTSGILRAGQTVKQFRQELARVNPHYRELAKSGRQVETSIRKADVASRGLLQTWRDVAVVSGAATLAFRGMIGSSNGLVGSIIKVNAEMERLQYQMQGMSVSAEPIKEAAASVEWLRKKATEAPFSLNQMANSFVKMKATGIDPMQKGMQSVMDGIAAFGGTDEHLHRVTLGIVQMSGKSVIQMEEMRQQLGESMPDAMRLMARSMGVSVAEMTKAISTGRVEAGAALDAFYNELERTYGGEAQRMMETFSGQVAQLKANLQILATGEGLKDFFEEQKSALQELNQFLQSDRAKAFAKALGEGLTSAVKNLRVVIETLYDFRSELITVGKVIAAGIGLRILTTTVTGFGTALNLARLKMAAMTAQIAAGGSAMALGAKGLMTGQAAATSLGLAAMGARTAFVGLAGTLSTVAPWLVLLGGAISIAAGRFGGMSEKTKEAYEELKKYGSESKKVAQQIADAREQQLRSRLETATGLYKSDVQIPDSMSDSRREAFLRDRARRERYESAKVEYAEATRLLNEFLEEKDGIIARAESDEQNVSLENFKKDLDRKFRESSVAYRQEQALADKQQQIELDNAEDNDKAIREIKKRYLDEQAARQEKQIRTRLQLIDQELKLLDDARAKEGSSDDFRANIDRQADYLNGKRVEIAQKLRDVGRFGIKLIANIEDDEAKIKRASKLLDTLQADVKGLQAELLGGSGAMSELQFKLKRGDFGSIEEGGQAVKFLHEQLLAATGQKEALDELMQGRRDLESDLLAAENKQLEERLELEIALSGELEASDADKIGFRLARGLYSGLGPMANIEEGIESLTGVTNIQGESMNQLGKTMRENTFGQSTIDKINKVREAIFGLSGAAGDFNNIGSYSENVNQDAVKDSSDWLIYSNQGAIRNKEISNRLKTAMSFLKDMGVQMEVFSGGQDEKGHGHQRTGSTRHDNGNAADVFFSRNEQRIDWRNKKDIPILQQIVAQAKANGVTGFGAGPGYMQPGSMHIGFGSNSVWGKDGKGVNAPSWLRQAAQGNPKSSVPVYNPAKITADAVKATEDAYRRVGDLKVGESVNADLRGQVELKKMLQDLLGQQSGSNVELEDGAGKNLSAVIAAITEGKFGPGKSVDDDQFKEILEVAKQLDATEKRISETKKARRSVDSETARLDEQRLEILGKVAEQEKLMANPDYKGPTQGFQRLQREMDQYLKDVEVAYGKESDRYREALDKRAAMLGGQRTLDVTTRRVQLNSEMRDIRDSLLSQGQLRDVQMKRDLERINQLAEEMRAAGVAEIEITRQIEEAKSLIRQKYMRETNPVAEQMAQWADLGNNLMESTTGWMDSIAGGITGLVTGTGDLKSALNSILSSVVNSYVKYFISNSFGSKASSGASKLGGKGGALAGGVGKFGVKHTGGVVGARGGAARLARADIFNNAPKFHTGGVVGMARSIPKLTHNEVPIIAKKKEGIFTPEQMAALAPVGVMTSGGNGAISISAPITVSGSAGTPEQNNDLAKKMAQEMEGTMRGVVVDEIRRQQRPGNMMNGRRR